MPRQYTRVPIAERLLKYGVRSSIGCLMWTGYVSTTGYGNITINGRPVGVHVASHLEWIGPIPKGSQVHHLCDVNYAPGDITYRRCFEPTHLTTGTPKGNSEHMAEVNRSCSGDAHPARMYPERMARGEQHWSHLRPERVARGERHNSRTRPETVLRGSKNGFSKLTEEDVLEIRRRRAEYGTTCLNLAKAFGVSHSLIKQIVNRTIWRHV